MPKSSWVKSIAAIFCAEAPSTSSTYPTFHISPAMLPLIIAAATENIRMTTLQIHFSIQPFSQNTKLSTPVTSSVNNTP